MNRMIWLIALAVPGLAGASPPGAAPGSAPVAPKLLSTPDTFSGAPHDLSSRDGTPTMRRQKLDQAIALREEAARLARENGGTLSPRQQAYIQRKARAILAFRRS